MAELCPDFQEYVHSVMRSKADKYINVGAVNVYYRHAFAVLIECAPFSLVNLGQPTLAWSLLLLVCGVLRCQAAYACLHCILHSSTFADHSMLSLLSIKVHG